MNDDILKGKWMQLRGEIRQTWGDLTDDDLDRIAGERDKLAGVLRERYGWSQEETDRRIDEWARDVEVRYGY
jgi:uncharacterized protein YjbJ (UPF0337 family)